MEGVTNFSQKKSQHIENENTWIYIQRHPCCFAALPSVTTHTQLGHWATRVEIVGEYKVNY